MLVKYHSKLVVFIKHDADIISNHKSKDYKIKLLKGQ